MAIKKLPQNSDVLFKFTNIEYNLDPTTVDLTSLDDIIFSISSRGDTENPLLVLKKSVSSSRFTLDNTDKIVTVEVVASEIGSIVGKYYCNLWLVESSRYVTHLSEVFEIVPTVTYVP